MAQSTTLTLSSSTPGKVYPIWNRAYEIRTLFMFIQAHFETDMFSLEQTVAGMQDTLRKENPPESMAVSGVSWSWHVWRLFTLPRAL
jgi:hypothetical protein